MSRKFTFPRVPYAAPRKLSLKNKLRVLLARTGTGYVRMRDRLGPHSARITEIWLLFGIVIKKKIKNEID